MYIRCVGFTLAGRIYEYKFRDSTEENGSIATSTKIKTSEKVKTKSFGGLSVWRETDVKGFDPDQWTVEQVWVPNPNDGVKVPMFIVRDKTFRKTGDSFCFLYGSPLRPRVNLIVGTAGSVFPLRRRFRLVWRPC
jgi:prolyl oligopeptidase PreP (S9A serine peptidase family)